MSVPKCLDDVFDNRRAAIVKNFYSSEPSNVVEVLERRRRDDLMAGCDDQLDSIALNACGATSDEKGLSVRLWRHCRIRQRREVFLKQSAGRGRQAERQNTGVLIGHGARDGRGHIDPNYDVFLECAFSRLVALWVHADCVALDTIANLEARDTLSHLDDLISKIAVHDEWIFDSREHHIASDLFEPIKRVDGDRTILDDHLVLTRGDVGGRLDLEGSGRFGGQPCRLVGRHDALAEEAARCSEISKTGRFESYRTGRYQGCVERFWVNSSIATARVDSPLTWSSRDCVVECSSPLPHRLKSTPTRNRVEVRLAL